LFELGFIPAPLTAFQGIYKLPAAHILTVENGQLRQQQYWQLAYPVEGHRRPVDSHEVTERFMAQLRQAVDAWRLSDVPVGSLLSGGIDSSALAALLTEVSGGPIHTFNIAFAAASHDESAVARQTAGWLGSRHHELLFDNDAFDHLPQVVAHLEEPQCSATSIPLYLLYRACRQAGFKVIMTGEGADELLAGYHWFDGDRRLRPLLAWPSPLRRLLAVAPLPFSMAGRRVLAQGTADAIERYALWHQVTPPDQLAALLPLPAPRSPLSHQWHEQYDACVNGRHPLNQFLYLESQTRLVDFINFEVDRMSMANSVEARPPFLDHHLWEFCAQLPPEYKVSSQGNKRLLRQALKDHLPAAVRQRPKQGLATPHAAWWRADKLPAWAEECLQPAALKATGYFAAAEVARLRRLHQAGKSDSSRLLMGVLTTQLWHQLMAISN
jgi:asparagine synthase (glutamine-hydrolysing)